MARRFSIGFELNTGGTSVEWTTIGNSPTIVTTPVRSGVYAGRVSSLASGAAKYFRRTINSAVASGPLFLRVYFRFATLPSAQNTILQLCNSGTVNTSVRASLTIDNTGVLRLFDEDGQIGSASGVLSTNTWYMVEIWFDRSTTAGTHTVKARLNETEFAAATNRDISTGILGLFVGANLAAEAQTTGDWYMDDIACNDNTGSYENSYPGPGAIIALRPNAAGDNADFSRGGSSPAAANFQSVDEVTPNDAIDFNASNTLNQIDDFNLDNTPADLISTSLIKVVEGHVRYNGASASSVASFVLRLKAAASGTVEEGSVLTPASTTWFSDTNDGGGIRLPSLVVYDMPGSSSLRMKKSDLDSAQLGVRISTGNTNNLQVSALWLLVEYDKLKLFDAVKGALAFGIQTPTNSEVAISYQTFTNGSGVVPSISGDADYGKLSLPVGAEGRSSVYDLGDTQNRQLTLNRDVYGTGSGAATLQIRGSSTPFNQDDASPSWTTYTTPTIQNWRYVQVRVVGA